VVAVTAWKRVLVHGAAGNVGALAVQMGHAAGAVVIAMRKRDDADYLRLLGADIAGDYGVFIGIILTSGDPYGFAPVFELERLRGLRMIEGEAPERAPNTQPRS
jgi:NADPH:quinone reductase-like Zn-dependent oxidoreductase